MRNGPAAPEALSEEIGKLLAAMRTRGIDAHALGDQHPVPGRVIEVHHPPRVPRRCASTPTLRISACSTA